MFKKKNELKNIMPKGVSLITLKNKNSPVSEQYRTIRTNIQFAMAESSLKTIVVTSSGPSEGKSTTSANLAVVFANSGLRVLLVDADLRKPTVAKTFNLKNERGLSNLLGMHEIAVTDVAQQTLVENLMVLPSGPKPSNPSEMLSSPKMNHVISQMEQYFDLVIFDMPPVVAVTDAQIMSAKVDGTILVVREGISNKNALLKAKHLLEMVDANILGAVYNGSQQSADQGYYYYGS
ncbi:CpsD/CapB family tyrosine-protein kinase [Vagococcus intermedius]|uniref:Tyrosine-protein kinase CpsD n=1 Tax=Vagococcus intermedius TaxID=2991418 RepID=A0AAF0CVJ8_9ENTE|nr:CpsD/CapB family tyrosine-protein kinase [Vagococcus intermedius]WEG73788.1 CpsD/CapB family tyrosine-protein kinase [Vagococcus intermedius]WEG75873.1 CpsD/CapB family tyrosine-protein kinase [Vagococcus intermedius]